MKLSTIAAAGLALLLQMSGFAASLTQFGLLYNYGNGSAKQALPSGVTVNTNNDSLNIPGGISTGSGTNLAGAVTLLVTNSTWKLTLTTDPTQSADVRMFLGNGPGIWLSTSAGTNENVGRITATALLAGSQTGTHASPSTTNPLSPTWTGAMHSVWYGVTGTINLPAASGYAGRGILVYNTGAFTITIDSNGSEVIVRDGTPQTGGVNFTLSSGAGNFVYLFCDGARWITLGYKGTLTLGT